MSVHSKYTFGIEFYGVEHLLMRDVTIRNMTGTYRKPILFSIGGNLESIVLKNIRSHDEYDNRTLFEIGPVYHKPDIKEQELYGEKQHIGTVVIQDLLVTADENDPQGADYITVYEKVDNLILSNVKILKKQQITTIF